MKLQIQADQQEAFQKCCIELGFTVQFHELEKEELKPLMVNAYVRDNQLGDLTNKLAFYLGMHFRGELQNEIYKAIGHIEIKLE